VRPRLLHPTVGGAGNAAAMGAPISEQRLGEAASVAHPETADEHRRERKDIRGQRRCEQYEGEPQLRQLRHLLSS
jgi:hypothetical protein